MTDAQTIKNLSAAPSESSSMRLLVFLLGHEQFAVPLSRVREVIALTETTPIPYAPAHFKGIMNLRGQIISVIDLTLKLRMNKTTASEESAIIILDLPPLSIGVIVDEVNCVHAIQGNHINEPPTLEAQISQEYLKGIFRKDDKLVLLLEIAHVLDNLDMNVIQRSKQVSEAA